VENFKDWELTYNAKLISTGHINVTLIHQVIAKALRDEAGSIGYLVIDDDTGLTGEDEEL
jgi:hypothetical protein